MKLIVGLGNPEPKYDMTRHNIGFMAVNYYIGSKGEKFKKKFNAEYAQITVHGEKVIVIKPQTYMNLSGEAVIKYMNFFDVKLEDVLVIYDDLDLNFTTIRLKKNSSHGGHNGIRNIIDHLKTKDFLRIKLGIKNEYKKDTKHFVLANFSKAEQQELNSIFEKTSNIIDDFIKDNEAVKLMNKYN